MVHCGAGAARRSVSTTIGVTAIATTNPANMIRSAIAITVIMVSLLAVERLEGIIPSLFLTLMILMRDCCRIPNNT